MAGDMDRRTARFGEELAERRPGDPEGDRPQPNRIERIREGAAQMPVPDRLDVDDAQRGEDKARLGIAGAERRQPVDVVNQLALRRGDREHRVDPQLGHQVFAVEAVPQPLYQKLAQSVEPVCRDREPGRHRMAAAVDQQPRLARGDHRRPQRQAGDRAAGAPADPIGERDNAGRPLIALLEPRGDDADDPGVPVFRRREDEHR